MSSIINKVKDAVSSNKHHDQPEGTHGHHNTRAANAADPRIDSDRDHREAPRTGFAGESNTIGSHGTHGTTGSGITGGNYTHSTSTNAGPHDSNVANKVDPRVDSDRDASRTVGGNNTYGTTGTTGSHGTGLTGTHGTTGTHNTTGLTGSHNTSTNAGPHDSNVANKLDPRVDSDRDASRTVGGNNTYGSTGTHGTGVTGSHGTTGLTGSHTTSTNAGPHDSNVANKLDPRVDSDRDASRTVGGNNTYGSTGTHGTTGLTGATGTHGTHGSSGLTGSHTTSTNAGPHDSNVANKVDPRVDSDRDASRTIGGNNTYGSTGTHGTTGLTGATGAHGTHGTHGAHHSGPGPAPSTAGPHKSDMMNKIDPRVDSDRDGSKTLGQDKTYSSDAHKDPTDAAQVPPSTLRKHVGEPEVHHDKHDKHGERHGSASHQETHRGL